MSPSDEPGTHREEEAPEPKPSRVEEARRIIEEYADDLREIIRKLRRKLS
ncbi:acyl-CoA thioesterase [Bradyrhizobium sp. AZCC 2230]